MRSFVDNLLYLCPEVYSIVVRFVVSWMKKDTTANGDQELGRAAEAFCSVCYLIPLRGSYKISSNSFRYL